MHMYIYIYDALECVSDRRTCGVNSGRMALVRAQGLDQVQVLDTLE